VGENIDSAILYNIRVSLEKMEYEIVAFEGRLIFGLNTILKNKGNRWS